MTRPDPRFSEHLFERDPFDMSTPGITSADTTLYSLPLDGNPEILLYLSAVRAARQRQLEPALRALASCDVGYEALVALNHGDR